MKVEDWSNIEHFVANAFRCPCCGRGPEEMDRKLIHDLDAARDDAGIPFVVTSGYRCPSHNAEVGGIASSAHIRGFAVDISCWGSRSRHKIITALKWHRFDRIGVANGFIHADKDPSKPSDVMWVY